MKSVNLKLCCISWIDEKSLPKVGFWSAARALASWPHAVLMGLVATSNPRPSKKIENVSAFMSSKQFRALVACSIGTDLKVTKVSEEVIDPGYTPAFDRSKIDMSIGSKNLSQALPIPDEALESHPGEKSALSGICTGKLHPCSTLEVPCKAQVIVSALIKFRAGEITNNIGIKEAESPVHVPWVWCEYALISIDSELQLLCDGSVFPSHAWYVNGTQVAERLQKQIAVSEHEPAISTGQPAKQIRTKAETDKSMGAVKDHQYAFKGGGMIKVAIK